MPDQDFERDVAAQLAQEGPQMRAPTWREQLSDAGQSVYETVAEQPLARLLDMLGASDFGGTAKSFTDPNAGVKRGEMPGGPGKDVAKVLKAISPKVYRGRSAGGGEDRGSIQSHVVFDRGQVRPSSAGHDALKAIRDSGFDVDEYDDAAKRWLATRSTASDKMRSFGGSERVAPPKQVQQALEYLNSLPFDDVQKLIQ